jgi:signal transduction histidine kinase
MMGTSMHRVLIGMVLATFLALYANANWMGRTLRIDTVPSGIESAVDDRPEGGKSVATLERRGHAHVLHCKIVAAYQWPFCEMDLRLGPDEHGMDLSAFDSISMSVRTNAKGPSGAIRVFLRNFDPAYSNLADGSTLKPHEVVFEPGAQPMPVEFKLSQFMVASWWTQAHPMGLNLLGPQLNNVTTFALTTGGAVVPGDYEIVLESVELHGLWISKANFRLGIILVWLTCIIGYLAFVWRDARKRLHASIQKSDDLHHYNETLEARVEERTRALSISNSRLIESLQTLERARDELVQNEKYAALGTLVAGVAHELNTPIGNAVLAASTIADLTRRLGEQAQSALTRTALNHFLAESAEGSQILSHNLKRAATLIASFKQLAADQHSGQRRSFALRDIMDETSLAMTPLLRHSGHQLVVDVPANIMLDGYPGPLSQVIINLVNNGLLHAFAGRTHGSMHIAAKLIRDDSVEIVYTDDGIGMPPQVLNRVFEPFFTTKLGKGGSGLGMHLVHNFITQLFGGTVQIESQQEKGTTIRIVFPLRAPNLNAKRAKIGVPGDVAEDYFRFLNGRDVSTLTHFGGPHSRRDVAELALFQREMQRLLPDVEIELVTIDSYAQGIEHLRLGRIAALATSSWYSDLEPFAGEIIISEAIVLEGQSVVGLFTRDGNTRTLEIKTLADLQSQRVVSNRDWSADWRTLDQLGVTRRFDVKTWRQMVYLVRSGEADLLLAPFPSHDNLRIELEGCVLVPVTGRYVVLEGTRHFAAARTLLGEQIADVVFREFSNMIANGTLAAAFAECGFLNSVSSNWVDIGAK